MIKIQVRTRDRRQMVQISADVQRAVTEMGIGDGLCHVWVPHTTAAVIVNENADPDVGRDLLAAYEAMVPNVRFRHAEGNSDAHLLSTLIGPSATIGVAGGRLQLGTWQGVFFVELDGPRTRSVWITEA
jgi:secondary thiamine-phosphate synthase enzyme